MSEKIPQGEESLDFTATEQIAERTIAEKQVELGRLRLVENRTPEEQKNFETLRDEMRALDEKYAAENDPFSAEGRMAGHQRV